MPVYPMEVDRQTGAAVWYIVAVLMIGSGCMGGQVRLAVMARVLRPEGICVSGWTRQRQPKYLSERGRHSGPRNNTMHSNSMYNNNTTIMLLTDLDIAKGL